VSLYRQADTMKRGENFLMRQVGDLTLLVPLGGQVVKTVFLLLTGGEIFHSAAQVAALGELKRTV
jgi:hypothetical protein